MAAGAAGAAAVAAAWLCAVALAVRAEPHGVTFVRKGDGAPWGQYFSPGFGGYYTMDDFRPEPQPVVHIPVIPVQPVHYETFEPADDQQQLVQGPDYSQIAQGPDLSQMTQGPDLSQMTQGPDLSQMTQGPDLGQMTQGPDLDQVTQGPDLVQETEEPQVQVTTTGYYPRPDVPDTQSTNEPDDVQQYTTPYPTTAYPTTPYPTTPYPTAYPTTPYPTGGYPTTDYPATTDYPHPTTWRPRPRPGACQANPAAAGYPRGTQLLCTVEACPSGGGVKGGVKGGAKGGVKGGYQGIIALGLKGGHGGHGGRALATTLVCRPFNGCDEPVQTTEAPEYTTPGYSVPEYTTPAYTTEYATPEYTTPEAPEVTTPAYEVPEYTTPVPTLPPPPPPPPGVKGGHRPHVPGVKGVKGVKGGVHQGWAPEMWSEGVKGVKGVKGGRGYTANVPAYGFQWGDVGADMQWGLKTHPRPARPAMGVKGDFQDESQQVVKGRPRGGYQFGGWGHQGYQGSVQDTQEGLYIL